MYCPYTYKTRGGGVIKGPWMTNEGSGFDYDPSSTVENMCSNERLGRFFHVLAEVILSGEPLKHKEFMMRIEPFIAPSETPYRYYNTFFMYKDSAFSGWKEMYPKYDAIIVNQSDAQGSEDLHVDKGFNRFFKELRDRFASNRFQFELGRDAEVALFLT